MGKKNRAEPARSRPLTLEALAELGALKGLAPPTDKFDPKGTWTATYRLWLVQGASGGGFLRLGRRPAKGVGVRLDVELAVAESAGYVRRTKAVLECADDALCSPSAWTLESHSHDVDDAAVAGTAVEEKGTVRDGRLEVRFGQQRRTRDVPTPLTSNWSLFEAVQRLPGRETKPLKFAMLEEMDLLKLDQRLEFREATGFELDGRKVALRGYQQFGRGVLPWQYWVDDSGRLLAAFCGVRAWIYDPQAATKMQDRLDTARQRLRRRRQAT